VRRGDDAFAPGRVVVTTVEEVRSRLVGVTDPEIPVVTIEDLGILRDVVLDGSRVVVTITPTYSGCPAMEEIRADICSALEGLDVEVLTVLSPAWTTDWMTDEGRRKLEEYGIAPPRRTRSGPVEVMLGGLTCPQCGSRETEELSRFGSTSCKSMWRCRTCREPFDHFKDH
jgi:ring-1,2-phenylacetyl-CoA epoxidase subunit PaaD